MIMRTELQEFSALWKRETDGTLELFRALPVEHYDLRPDPGGRSLGELAWHLAEVDAFISLGIARRSFIFSDKPPRLERPRRVEELAPAFRIVHDDAVARLAPLQDTDLDSDVRYADGHLWTVRNLLWQKLLLHHVHHRGQLTVLCRLAGGVPPPLFGRTRETTPARRPAPAGAAV
jgi:uncharacterized damage-inducible protein DinB